MQINKIIMFGSDMSALLSFQPNPYTHPHTHIREHKSKTNS